MMSPTLAAVLFFSSNIGLCFCVQFHAEHIASHQTALWRREKSSKDGSYVHNAINISTQLKDYSSEFIGTIGIGTNADGNPLFKANVVFDTGSTNLWVASHLCQRCAINTAGQALYNPRHSVTHQSFIQNDRENNLHVYFGTGELEGPIHKDTYHVGPMEVKHQPFAMIRESSGLDSLPWMDGILGLAFPSMSFGHVKPFFDHVIEQNLLDHNEFAFFLSKDKSKPSTILWGGVDQNLYHGPIRMLPVNKPHYWSLQLLEVKVGDKSLKLAADGKKVRSLVVDSGTTFYTAPTELYNQIKHLIPKATLEDCQNGAARLPSITYVLRGADKEKFDLVIPPEAYLVLEHGDTKCAKGLMELNVNNEHGPLMVLGEVFMRNFFTVFDRGDGKPENARIGIAPANTDATPKMQTSSNLPEPNLQLSRKPVVETNAHGDNEVLAQVPMTRKSSIVRRVATIVPHHS